MIKYFNKIGNNSKKASIKFVSKKKKNKVLFDFANLVALNKEKIINQNKKDQKYAIKKGLRSNMLQRLILNNESNLPNMKVGVVVQLLEIRLLGLITQGPYLDHYRTL